MPLIWLKARRMRVLTGDTIGTGRLMQMYVASYAADNLVMSQAGLGVRVAMLVRDGVALAVAVTVQVVEKVVEGIGLAIVALPLLASDDLDTALRTTLRLCLAIGGIGAMHDACLAAMHTTQVLKDKSPRVTAYVATPTTHVGGALALHLAHQCTMVDPAGAHHST